jgi:hypothetical protein
VHCICPSGIDVYVGAPSLTLQTSATGDFAENKSKWEGAMTTSGQNAEFQAVEDGDYRAEEEDLTE